MMDENEAALIAEQVKHALDLLRAEIGGLQTEQACDRLMMDHRLAALEALARDHEERLRAASDGVLQFNAVREKARDVFLLKLEGATVPPELRFTIDAQGRRHRFVFMPNAADTITIVCAPKTGALVGINGQWEAKPRKGDAIPAAPVPLAFARLDTKKKPACLLEKDWLRQRLLSREKPAKAARPRKKSR